MSSKERQEKEKSKQNCVSVISCVLFLCAQRLRKRNKNYRSIRGKGREEKTKERQTERIRTERKD